MEIFKYEIEPVRLQELMLPKGAQILTVQLQGERWQLWAIVDEAAPLEPRQIARYYTGMSKLPSAQGVYIATVQSEHGWHVDHFFDVTLNEQSPNR